MVPTKLLVHIIFYCLIDKVQGFPFLQKELSANVKLSKNQISKIILSERFLGRLLEPLMKVGLLLMKNVLGQLAKSMLITIRLTRPLSALDTGVHNNILGSGASGPSGSGTRTLIISNKEMEEIMKIDKSSKDSSLLIKGFRQTIDKKQRDGLLGMLLCKLVASLLEHLLADKGVIRVNDEVRRVGEDFQFRLIF